jgi:hypothetical protein
MFDVPLFLILLTARAGCLCLSAPLSGNSAPSPHAFGSAAGGDADVRPNYKTGALSNYKTGGNAGVLFRR